MSILAILPDLAGDAAKTAAEDAAKAAAENAAKAAAQDAAEDAAKTAAEDAAKTTAENAAKTAAQDVAENAAKTAAQDAAANAAKTTAQDAAGNAAKTAAQDAAENAAKTAADDAAETAAESATKVTGNAGKSVKSLVGKASEFASANQKLVLAGLVTAAAGAYLVTEAERKETMRDPIVSITNTDGGVEVQYTDKVQLWPDGDTVNFEGTNCSPTLGDNVEIVKQIDETHIVVKAPKLDAEGNTGIMTINTSVESQFALTARNLAETAGNTADVIAKATGITSVLSNVWSYASIAMAILLFIVVIFLLKYLKLLPKRWW